MTPLSAEDSSKPTYNKSTRNIDLTEILIEIVLGWIVGVILDKAKDSKHAKKAWIRISSAIQKREETILHMNGSATPFFIVGLLTYWITGPTSIEAFILPLMCGLFVSLLFSVILDFFSNQLYERANIYESWVRARMGLGNFPIWWRVYEWLVTTAFPVIVVEEIRDRMRSPWGPIDAAWGYLEKDGQIVKAK